MADFFNAQINNDEYATYCYVAVSSLGCEGWGHANNSGTAVVKNTLNSVRVLITVVGVSLVE